MKRIICVMLTALIASSAVLAGCSNNNSNTDNTKATASTDASVKTTGGKIHINDSTLGEIWISELEGVPVNKLDNSNFTADSTLKYYNENGNSASVEGVDISSYSGNIDWARVKNAGIDFAMIRIGGRGYGDDGKMYADDTALTNIQNAKAAGIKVGVYFFSQAINPDEAVEEAEYVKTLLGDTTLDYPVAYDWEIIKDEEARTDSVTASDATASARAFCDKVKEYGYTPIIYSPSRELYFKYDLQQLADIDIWYCEYSNVPTFYYQFSMWQYSSTGTVDGIDGSVDLNVCFTNVADYD